MATETMVDMVVLGRKEFHKCQISLLLEMNMIHFLPFAMRAQIIILVLGGVARHGRHVHSRIWIDGR